MPPGGGNVLALSDALRGELYAGCWQITPGHVALRGAAPRAVPPESLASAGGRGTRVDPAALIDAVAHATERQPITGPDALPDARTLLMLGNIPGATTAVHDAAGWQPDYGRPAEAQVLWERAHGRELPATPGISR